MIRMTKKGFDKTVLIGNSSVGLRESEELGTCVCLRFGDYELLVESQKAKSMALTILAKVGALEKEELLKNQTELPIEGQGVNP